MIVHLVPAGPLALAATSIPTLLRVLSSSGKWVFIGALVALLVWLAMMPRTLIGQAKSVPVWWRNVRVWAIVICLVQIWIYWRYG